MDIDNSMLGPSGGGNGDEGHDLGRGIIRIMPLALIVQVLGINRY